MNHEQATVDVKACLRKYRDDQIPGLDDPYETLYSDNLLMYGGVSKMWEATIGNSITAFSHANAHIGVGDSNTAVAATQTDLQASSNKVRQAMDLTYPVHADGTTSGAASIVFKSTFAAGTGTFTWNEWGIFNASSTGSMLDRAVVAWGAKGAGDTWTVTVTITIN